MKPLFTCLVFIFIFPLVGSANESALNKPTNPDISVNALVLGRSGSKGTSGAAENPNGFDLQEAEVRFTSSIDAYLRGDAIIAIEREDGEFKFEPEEVYIETTFLPAVTLKAGKFLLPFGKHNLFHTHYMPFVDAPLANQNVLGEEGLNEVGVSAAYLLPIPWFSEISTSLVTARNSTNFNPNNRDKFLSSFNLKNLWDLSEDTTFEVLMGLATGENSAEGNTKLYNVATTLKWRGSPSSALIWTTEYLKAQRGGVVNDRQVGGVGSWMQYQFAKQWWVQGRYEYLGLPKPDAGSTNKWSSLVAFVPTEFSAVRFQYDNISAPSDPESENRFSLQFNVTWGSHPAHNY